MASISSISSASAAISLILEALSKVPFCTASREKLAVSVKVPILPLLMVSVILSPMILAVSIKAVESVTSLKD